MSTITNDPALFVPTTEENESRNTPACVYERILRIDSIGLDPCSNPTSRVPAECRLFKEDDGLRYTWRGHGLVYCNPPYGRVVRAWIQHGIEQEVEIIYLLPARTETKWFQYHFGYFSRVLFWDGRLVFEDAETGLPMTTRDKKTGKDRETGAPFPSVLFYYGHRPEAFELAFAGCGLIVVPERVHWLTRSTKNDPSPRKLLP